MGGCLPILDLQLWVDDYTVLYQLYEKFMTPGEVISWWSALFWNTKKVSLAGDLENLREDTLILVLVW